MQILITGVAGFIGFHLAKRLLNQGETVVGLDNLNEYYDVRLKLARLAQLKAQAQFQFVQMELGDRSGMTGLFQTHQFERVVNLAAQAGVRYSLQHPHSYIDSNIVGFLNVLEGCRHQAVPHLVFASSSSVYGLNTQMPFSVHQTVDHPISLYAATKKANELMAHSYAYLYQLPTTGLRFFTVYGPWGRPDMALFKFTEAILRDQPIEVYNQGQMYRDFTYIDDIVEGIMRVLNHIPQPNPHWSQQTPDPGSSVAPYRLYNIGHQHPVALLSFIEELEHCLGKTAHKLWLPLQAGDVPATFADVSDLKQATGFQSTTSVQEGIRYFVEWYKDYYGISSV